MGKEEQIQPKVSEQSHPKGFKLRYYTLLDEQMQPRATICLAFHDGTAARGISICSRKEFLEEGFKDEEGRTKSRRRAYKAWNRRTNVDETIRIEAWQAIASIPIKNIGVPSNKAIADFFRYKGVYGAKLTAQEKRILDREPRHYPD